MSRDELRAVWRQAADSGVFAKHPRPWKLRKIPIAKRQFFDPKGRLVKEELRPDDFAMRIVDDIGQEVFFTPDIAAMFVGAVNAL